MKLRADEPGCGRVGERVFNRISHYWDALKQTRRDEDMTAARRSVKNTRKAARKSRSIPRPAWPAGTCSVIAGTVTTATISRITSGSRGNSGYVSSLVPHRRNYDH